MATGIAENLLMSTSPDMPMVAISNPPNAADKWVEAMVGRVRMKACAVGCVCNITQFIEVTGGQTYMIL